MHQLPLLLWFDESLATDAALVGPKAARLATMSQAGLPVPAAFVLTTEAFRRGMDDTLQAALSAAYRRLVAHLSRTTLTKHVLNPAVAVRSSAIAEDLEGASFAGMQETVLNVCHEKALVDAVRKVWHSVESVEARAYRERIRRPWHRIGVDTDKNTDKSAMAVLVQLQVVAQSAGVAFARDPLTGEEAIVVEAVAGLGEKLVSGEAEPQRWRIVRDESAVFESEPAQSDPLLSDQQLNDLVSLLKKANALFAAAQDIEWACDHKQVWMLQSRPITTLAEDWFTDYLPNDEHLWTAAFLNERFTQPVSPLGWSLVAKPLERLALRAPLELLGVKTPPGTLLKLWRGHPYSRVTAWQQMYKLFPDALLPEDAERYFPQADMSLRSAPHEPSFGSSLLRNGLRLLKDHFAVVSPLHNPQTWDRYERKQEASFLRFRFAERQLKQAANPIPSARALLKQTADLTDELLDLHRWSLLYADLSYSLLRRMLIMRYGTSEGTKKAVQLTSGISSPTTRMNGELNRLATQVAQNEALRSYLTALSTQPPDSIFSEKTLFAPTPQSQLFLDDLRHFLKQYGHRFFSLDFYDPPWEADHPAFARFLLTLARGKRPPAPAPPPILPSSGHALGEGRADLPPGAGGRFPLKLTRAYLRLRESQRFHWQQLLALQRRVVLVMGKWWSEQGQLLFQEHVFGLTWDELMEAQPDKERAATRMKQLQRLRAEAQQVASWHYPDFLSGNKALRPRLTTKSGTISELSQNKNNELIGRPVSAGIARGPARLITRPDEFERLQRGDILVTSSPDPGWTPIFDTVAGLVTERGGQLSHSAVVAREYGLPAVSGIPGLLNLLEEGEMLLVDGTQGVVVRLDAKTETKRLTQSR